jgi:hypothetical protein
MTVLCDLWPIATMSKISNALVKFRRTPDVWRHLGKNINCAGDLYSPARNGIKPRAATQQDAQTPVSVAIDL